MNGESASDESLRNLPVAVATSANWAGLPNDFVRRCRSTQSPLHRVDKHLVPGGTGMGGRSGVGPAARVMLLTLYCNLSMAIPMVS